MKKDNINIEQWAIWGGAVIFILLAVTLLVVFRVWMPQTAAMGGEPDATLVAKPTSLRLCIKEMTLLQ